MGCSGSSGLASNISAVAIGVENCKTCVVNGSNCSTCAISCGKCGQNCGVDCSDSVAWLSYQHWTGCHSACPYGASPPYPARPAACGGCGSEIWVHYCHDTASAYDATGSLWECGPIPNTVSAWCGGPNYNTGVHNAACINGKLWDTVTNGLSRGIGVIQGALY